MSTEVARPRTTDADAAVQRTAAPPRRSAWTVLTGAVGATMGVAPHVLHHVGPLVGTALVAGAGGTALFGLLGLIASVPMLLRLRRRFGSWRAPALALVAFTAMFLISALVIGPRISGADDPAGPEITEVQHGEHHPS